jgi:hypothetical protein
MPKFVIERELTGVGKLPKNELQAISQKSCGVLLSMGPQIQWLQSFVTDDKIYVSTLRRMKGLCARMPKRAVFQRTEWRACAR